MPRQKVKKGWTKYTNLSIKEKDYVKLRRMFEVNYTGDKAWIEWLTIMADGMISRYKIIKQKYPHLKIVSVVEDGVIIEDTKQKKVIKIDSKLEAEPEYLQFALLHPEFRLNF